MANKIRIKRRAAGGAAGAPAGLDNAELAFNEQDNTLYYGTGTGGVGGTATQVIAIGGSGAFAPASHVGTGGVAHADAVANGADGFMTGADKAKLDGITSGANAYTHPANHPASVITQDASNRFVTDAEKTAWNAKQPAGTYATGTGTASGTNTGDQTTITGNAGSATVLQTARTINGVSFNGAANITINAVDATARVASSLLGAVNGVATLDASGLVPSGQLPSYVDDVLEYTNLAGFPATGTAGKIYVALDTNKTYRWSGTVYVYITSGAVDSVGGNTGVVTNAQISAAATAGYGFTPYSNTNPSGFTTNTGTVTGVSGTAPIASSGGTAPVISIAAATTSVPGSMSAADKLKLDGIAASANAYSLPTADASTLGGIKVGSGLTITAGVLAAAGGAGAPALISTNTNATAASSYVMTAALTLTLPAGPALGTVVEFQNVSGALCTIAMNGSSIMGLAEDLTLDIGFSSAKVVFMGGATGWALTDATSTALASTAWANITSKPTTVAGYGITDAVGVTNLAQGTRMATSVIVTSSTGTGATLAEATQTLAGVLSAADKTKIDNLTSMTFDGGTY